MSKIAPLSGFPELLPAQRAVEREVIASVSRTFELHGFTNIETRVVEPIERLAKGGEVDKEIYVLQRIAAEPDTRAELGLHFDLTVPFARYVLEHAGHLEFPFRRFQVQPAWRGERPQEGRYRQFTQADVADVSELMFSGDLLFAGSIGRTDLPGGDHAAMLRSLADKVLPLADDIVVLPGHGEQTSIGRERATNPFLLDLPQDPQVSNR
jgi:histidyl-tRNA synthetase